MKEVTPKRKFLIDRLGYLRSQANISARDLSLTIDKSYAYIAKFENGDFSMPAEVLLDAIEACKSTPEEFFWQDIRKYKEQKDFITGFEQLSDKGKETIMNLIKELK